MSSNFEQHERAGKLAKKEVESPLMVMGVAGLIAAAAYGIYGFKKRNMSTSVFLMQLRLAVQGSALGALTIGLAYSMAKEYIFDKIPKQE